MQLSIRKKTSIVLSKIPTRLYYIAVGLLIIPAYIIGWQILTYQSTSYLAILSKMTVNLVILFFLVGMWTDKYTKGMPKLKGWLIWAAVTITLILFFKYIGGMETRF